MNVGQILETHLGWAAKILGFYAKTPTFSGANEREIGLVLKLAGLTWARGTLNLHNSPLNISDEDVRTISADVGGDSEKVVLMDDARLSELGGRNMSAETKDVFNRVRDFLSQAAREMAEREEKELQNQAAMHTAMSDDESLSASRRAEAKATSRQLEASGPGTDGSAGGSRTAGTGQHAWPEIGSGRRCGGGRTAADGGHHARRQDAPARRSLR
jgi:hypothetical protein